MSKKHKMSTTKTIIIVAALALVVAGAAWAATTPWGQQPPQNSVAPKMTVQVTLTNEQTGVKYTTQTTSGGVAHAASIAYQPVSTLAFSFGGLGGAMVPLSADTIATNNCQAKYGTNSPLCQGINPPAAPTLRMDVVLNLTYGVKNIPGMLTVLATITGTYNDPSVAPQSTTFTLVPGGNAASPGGTCSACVSPDGSQIHWVFTGIPVKNAAGATLHQSQFTPTVSVTGIDLQGNTVTGNTSAPFTVLEPAGSLTVGVQASPMSISGFGYDANEAPVTWSQQLQPYLR